MAKKIYVGNLPWSATSASLEALFSEHGTVQSAEVISDRETGRSRGFGFVTFTEQAAGEQAISSTHGQDLGGRKLVVNEARPMEPRSGGGGGGGFNRRNGGGGYSNSNNNRRDNGGY